MLVNVDEFFAAFEVKPWLEAKEREKNQWKFLIHTILQSLTAKRTSWNVFSTAMASAVICLSKGQRFNFSKYIFDSLVLNVDSSSKFYMYPRFIQLIIQAQVGDLSTHTTCFISPILTQKVVANMRRVGEGFSEVETSLFEVEDVAEDVAHVATPSPPYHGIPNDNVAQRLEIVKLKERVKKLEKTDKVKSLNLRRLRKDKGKGIMIEAPKPMKKKDQIEIDAEYARKKLSEEAQEAEDLRKRLAVVEDEDDDVFAEATPLASKTVQAQEISSLKKRVKRLEKKKRSRTHRLNKLYKIGLSTRVKSSADEQSLDITTARIEEIVSTAAPITTADVTPNELTMAEALVEIKKSKPKGATTTTTTTVTIHAPDSTSPKGRGVVKQKQSETPTTTTTIQISSKVQDQEKSRLFMELMDKRKKNFSKLRAEEQRTKPPTKAQKRNRICVYLKNMARFTHKQLKNKNFDEVLKSFDKTMSWINSFVPMDFEVVKDKIVLTQESNSKRVGDKLDQERSKKQKVKDDKESNELKRCLEIIPDDRDDITIDDTPLSIKTPIIDYKIYKEGKKSYFQLFRADGNSQMYYTFSKMLKNFDKEDLTVLWRLVKDIFIKSKPVDDMDSFLLHTLKTMFELYVKDTAWKNQQGLTKDDKDADADDEGDEHISDTQDADDEDEKTKTDEDEIYKYMIREEAEKTSEAKDDTKKSKLRSSSSSLFVSLGFGDQFLKLFSDSSLVSTVKDSVDADVIMDDVGDDVDPQTFNDLMAIPIDFSKYVLNGLKIENLTQGILLGPAINLLKGMCSTSIELKYNFQECFNALTDKIDWNNPAGDQVTYTTSIMKTKAARYEIKGIKDMVPKLWSTIKHAYDKYAFMGIKHWGERCKLWYRYQKKIMVKRSDHLEDIKDMLLLAVQHKLFHLDGSDIVDFIVALRMFTRTLILKRRVKDLQLGVERIVYEDLDKQKKVLRSDGLYKFSDVTLKSVRNEIHHRVLDFYLDYNPEMPKRKWTVVDQKRSGLMIELIDKQLREKGNHQKARAIGWCKGTRDGLQTYDAYCLIV
nr:hypothetical protein [Tanacetum cinerariifolium]